MPRFRTETGPRLLCGRTASGQTVCLTRTVAVCARVLIMGARYWLPAHLARYALAIIEDYDERGPRHEAGVAGEQLEEGVCLLLLAATLLALRVRSCRSQAQADPTAYEVVSRTVLLSSSQPNTRVVVANSAEATHLGFNREGARVWVASLRGTLEIGLQPALDGRRRADLEVAPPTSWPRRARA